MKLQRIPVRFGMDRRFATKVRKLAAHIFPPPTPELAARLMTAFNEYHRLTHGSFVDFVKLLDPSLPYEPQQYRKHRTFQACDYLRRVHAKHSRG